MYKLNFIQNMIGIYKITNPNERVYIGQTNNISKRLNKYYNLNCTKQPRLYRSLKKHGVENHKFEIIEECELEELNERERFWQEFYDVLSSKGMNCSYVQTFTKKGKVKEESCKKLSKALTGRKLSSEHVEKIKIALSKRIVSDKVRESARKLSKGKKLPREQVEKMRQTKLSLNLECPWKLEIIQTDLNNNFIQTFNSIQLCSQVLNICRPNIIKVLKGYRKTAGGFKFYYSAQNKLGEFRETPEVDNPEPSFNLND